MRNVVAFLVWAGLGACSSWTESEAAEPGLQLRGAVLFPPGVQNVDAWVFLFAPDAGYPGPPAFPLEATASSRHQPSDDRRYVFADLPAKAYRLLGIADVQGNFDPSVDVLAQPSAGDWVSEGAALDLSDGQNRVADCVMSQKVDTEIPALSLALASATGEVLLGPQGGTLQVSVDALGGLLDVNRLALRLSVADRDGDGRIDDLNGDGLPDLAPQFLLRWTPGAGALSAGESVVVPLLPNPLNVPWLSALADGGSLEVQSLELSAPPLALRTRASGTEVLTSLPLGTYELWVFAEGGQFWKLPNGLAARFPSQAGRVRVVP